VEHRSKSFSEIFEDRSVREVTSENYKDYYWYLDERKEVIGISKEITETERDLIHLLYQPLLIEENFDDEQTVVWKNYLKGKSRIEPKDLQPTGEKVQFIFFDHEDLEYHMQGAFKDLLHGFQEKIRVLFYPHYAVVLNFLTSKEDRESLDQVLAAAKADFNLKTSFYKTIDYAIDDDNLSSDFDEQKVFLWDNDDDIAKDLFTYKDVFSNILLSSLSCSNDYTFINWFRPFFDTEADLIAVVKCYLEQSSNVSNVAKAMYMHRNTVMNKIDRFIEITGLDIRQFDEAVVTYMLIKRREKGVDLVEHDRIPEDYD